MRSKTSCFNGTLFRKNLSRYWPLWGLASFGGAMFPLAMLLELLHNGFRFWSPLETRQAYYTVLSYGVPVIAIVYAILCAMAVWSYLYNARSAYAYVYYSVRLAYAVERAGHKRIVFDSVCKYYELCASEAVPVSCKMSSFLYDLAHELYSIHIYA